MTTERKTLYILLVCAMINAIIAMIQRAPAEAERYTHVLLIWGLLKLDSLCIEMEVVDLDDTKAEDPKNE